MAMLIQKFGGTSMATVASREAVIRKIKQAKDNGDQPVVVVSAMGRLGAPYATDTLLGLLGSTTESTKVSLREKDLLMGCGEIIAALVLSQELLAAGLVAEALTGGQAGIVTTNQASDGEVVSVDTRRLMRLVEREIIPVVAGFQGKNLEGDLVTLGRGGSDYSAAILGEALEAKRVEIYTDVDGIMTTDPKLCQMARPLQAVSYNEVFQMADSGAKVIHSKAVEVGRRSGIPLIIKNTFTETEGTAITDYRLTLATASLKERLITSIAHRSNRLQVIINGQLDDMAFFEELASVGVSIDIINIFPQRRVFTIDADKKLLAMTVMEKYNADYQTIEDCCKVTVIGERMTGVPGVMAKIINSLTGQGIDILQTADSLSTIACLIYEKDLEKAVQALHRTFGLD